MNDVLDPAARRLVAMLSASGASEATPDRDVEARRRGLQRLSAAAANSEDGHAPTRDMQAPGPAGPIPVRLYDPPGGAGVPLVWLHGGGWVAGGFDTHDALCRRLAARSGASVVAVDYRRAPEHRFPAAFEDALSAVRWTAEAAHALGLRTDKLAIGGDSVGGGLAAAVALSPDVPPLALQVLLCPIVDLVNERPSRRKFGQGFFVDRDTFAADVRDYCADQADLGDPRLSPLLANHLGRQPPALIHAAGCDPFRDEAQAYADRLADEGVSARCIVWPGMIHYFYLMDRAIPSAGPALDEIARQVRDALA